MKKIFAIMLLFSAGFAFAANAAPTGTTSPALLATPTPNPGPEAPPLPPAAEDIIIYFNAGWNLFSVPVYSGASAELKQNTCARQFAYSFVQGSYQKQPVNSLEPNTGYWFKAPFGCEMTFAGDHTITFAEYALKLRKGWNLIGAPFDAIRFSDAADKVKCEIESGPWEWRGTDYQKAYYLETGKAYWVKVAADCRSENGKPTGRQHLKPGESVKIGGKTLKLASISPIAANMAGVRSAYFELFDKNGGKIDSFFMGISNLEQTVPKYAKNGIEFEVTDIYVGSGETSFAEIKAAEGHVLAPGGELQMTPGDQVAVSPSRLVKLISISPSISRGAQDFNDGLPYFEVLDERGNRLDYFSMDSETAAYNKNGVFVKVLDVVIGAADSSYVKVTVEQAR